jgi:hypothetical protein
MQITITTCIHAIVSFLVARWRWACAVAAGIALAGLIYAGFYNKHSWNWGDFPSWIAAITTGGLLIGAAFTVYFARKAFIAQSQQLKDQQQINVKQTVLLDLQVQELQASLEERKREDAERRRAQASLVFTWEELATVQSIGTGSAEVITVFVKNTSEQPIYDLRFTWAADRARYDPTVRAKPLMPGDGDSDFRPMPVGAEHAAFGAAVIFRDRNYFWWRVRPNGRLDDLGRNEVARDDW